MYDVVVQLYSVHYLLHSTKTTNLHTRDFPKEIFREITYILFNFFIKNVALSNFLVKVIMEIYSNTRALHF